MPSELSLTPTSYLVLGTLGELGPSTPYDMKQFVAQSIGYFWSFPHSQLYAEPARLAEAGLLREEQEADGRKRKLYRLTKAGRRSLARWLAEPSADTTEIRDLGLLKLFFGNLTGPTERQALADEQRRAHEARRADYEDLRESVKDLATPYQLSTLEMGLRFERAAAAFWAEIGADESA